MDLEKIRSLNILEEISRNDHTSQRALSKKLNISLGLVNAYIKRLASKRYFKISNKDNKQFKYTLTPEGFAEKARLANQYNDYSLRFYRATRKNIRNLLKKIENKGVKRVVLWGTTELAEITYFSLKETSIEPVAVVDSRRQGTEFFDKRVRSCDDLDQLNYELILFASDRIECATNADCIAKLEKQGELIYIN